MTQGKLLDRAVSRIRELAAVGQIILYDSARSSSAGHRKVPNDVDIAVILDDLFRGMPLDEEGFPIGHVQTLNAIANNLSSTSPIPLHVASYWESEFREGIDLYSGRGRGHDMLHEVGKVLYHR